MLGLQGLKLGRLGDLGPAVAGSPTLAGRPTDAVFPQEIGYRDLSMVLGVYGQLGTIKHRAPVVEYRVEQHKDLLGDRLQQLRSEVAS